MSHLAIVEDKKPLSFLPAVKRHSYRSISVLLVISSLLATLFLSFDLATADIVNSEHNAVSVAGTGVHSSDSIISAAPETNAKHNLKRYADSGLEQIIKSSTDAANCYSCDTQIDNAITYVSRAGSIGASWGVYNGPIGIYYGSDGSNLPSAPNYHFDSWEDHRHSSGSNQQPQGAGSGQANVVSVPQFDFANSRWTLSAQGDCSGTASGDGFSRCSITEDWSLLFSEDCDLEFSAHLVVLRSGPQSGWMDFEIFGQGVLLDFGNLVDFIDTTIVGDVSSGYQPISYMMYSEAGPGSGSSGSIAFELSVIIEPKLSSKFVVVDDSGKAISNVEFDCYKLTSGAPTWDSDPLGTFVSDTCGGIIELEPLLTTGDILKIEARLHSEPAVKHQSVLGTIYSVWLDNAKMDPQGQISYHEVTDSKSQKIKLDHTTIHFNFLASIEWDALLPYIQTTEAGFRNMANYLYDVFDGQVVIDTIKLFDNREHWEDADIRIHASNMEWPRANVLGWQSNSVLASQTLLMPRRFFGNYDLNRNSGYAEDPLDMNDPIDYRTRAHELGHYLFGFYDEYTYGLTGSKCANGWIYGFMESHYDQSGPLSSEMSSNFRYVSSASCQNTDQWNRRGTSCWDFFELQYEKTWGIDETYAPIVTPDEKVLVDTNVFSIGPNESYNLELDYNVGALIKFPVAHVAPLARTVDLNYSLLPFGQSHVSVTLRSMFGSPIFPIPQGNLTDDGKIKILGARTGNVVDGFGVFTAVIAKNGKHRASSNKSWLSGSAVVGSNDELALTLSEVSGDHPFIPMLSPGVVGSTLLIDMDSLFVLPPNIEAPTVGGGTQNLPLSTNTGGYLGQWNSELPASGTIEIIAVDDSSKAFNVPVEFAVVVRDSIASAPDLFARDGSASLTLDLGSGSPGKVAILSSPYPIMRSGLTETNLQVGHAHAVFSFPDPQAVAGEGLTIHYADSELGDSVTAVQLEPSIRMFAWNRNSRAWEIVGGIVDTVHNSVAASISGSGAYALFSTLEVGSVPCGDFNASGGVNIADAVYMINYIFASGPAPQDNGAGDINCSGTTDIVDAVYLVNYIFSSGAAPCAACP